MPNASRTVVSRAILFIVLVIGATAEAEDLDVTTLGAAPVDYVEHRMSINAGSWISWSELDNGYPEARVSQPIQPTFATIDLQHEVANALDFATDTSAQPRSNVVQGRAEDLTEAFDAGGGNVLPPYVVGYAADARQLSRYAMVWVADGTVSPSGPAAEYVAYDLHLATEDALGTTQLWTAAYGAFAADSDLLLVVGQRRESLDQRSVPVLWQIRENPAGGPAGQPRFDVQVVDLPIPGNAAFEYGIAYDVTALVDGSTEDVRVVGGTGSGTAGTPYMEATEWRYLTIGGSVVVNDGQKMASFTEPTFASSVATRIVRGLDDGSDPSFVIVGSAVDSRTAPAGSKAFSCRYVRRTEDSCSFVEPGNEGPALDASTESLGFGVAARPVIVQSAKIVGTATDSVLTTAAIAGTLTGYFSYAGLYTPVATSEDFNDCDVDDSDGASGDVRTIYDVNDEGVMIGRDGSGNAVVLSPTRSAFEPTVYVRRSTDVPSDYWWVEMPGATSNVLSDIPNGGFAVSEVNGCSSFAACGDVALNLADEGAEAAFAAWEGVYARTPADTAFVPYSPQQTFPAFFDPANLFASTAIDAFMLQAAISYDSGLCELHDEIETFAYEAYAAASGAEIQLNPPFDPFGGIWGDCDGDASNGAETDTSADPNNCGACNNTCATGLGCEDGECADIVISEFEYDPPTPDTQNEWVEIYVTRATVDPSGYRLLDQQGFGEFPAGSPVLQGGQYYVLAACADQFDSRWGFLPDFEYRTGTNANGCSTNTASVPDLTLDQGGDLQYSNSGDDVGFEDADGNLLSGISYGNDSGYSPVLPDISSGSWALQDLTDEDNASAWARDTSPTPGAPNN